jgi:hypothetical protein
MGDLPKRVRKALEIWQEAKDSLDMAEEALRRSLPEDVADEIHYNGHHANIPAEYRPVLVALRGKR